MTVVVASDRRAPRISQADVFHAADELLLQGARPTIDRVRMRLGRGSPNTINDHLDAWWAKLGARLRDLPGREFPQLPEHIALSLQSLWNAALEAAHERLQATIQQREEALRQSEQTLADNVEAFKAHTESVDARASAVEESLTLAREQLSNALLRVEALERSVGERDELLIQARGHAQATETASAELRAQLSAVDRTHREERARLHDQYLAAESRWLQEVDRARQAVKESERAAKALSAQLSQVTRERDRVRLELTEVRGELRAVRALHLQLRTKARGSGKKRTPPRRGARLRSPAGPRVPR